MTVERLSHRFRGISDLIGGGFSDRTNWTHQLEYFGALECSKQKTGYVNQGVHITRLIFDSGLYW